MVWKLSWTYSVIFRLVLVLNCLSFLQKLLFLLYYGIIDCFYIAFVDLNRIFDFSFLKIHYFDLHAYLFLRIVIPRNVLILFAMNEALLDALETENADQDSQGVIQDVRDEIPEALIRWGIWWGERDGDGEVDEMRH